MHVLVLWCGVMCERLYSASADLRDVAGKVGGGSSRHKHRDTRAGRSEVLVEVETERIGELLTKAVSVTWEVTRPAVSATLDDDTRFCNVVKVCVARGCVSVAWWKFALSMKCQ